MPTGMQLDLIRMTISVNYPFKNNIHGKMAAIPQKWDPIQYRPVGRLHQLPGTSPRTLASLWLPPTNCVANPKEKHHSLLQTPPLA